VPVDVSSVNEMTPLLNILCNST